MYLYYVLSLTEKKAQKEVPLYLSYALLNSQKEREIKQIFCEECLEILKNELGSEVVESNYEAIVNTLSAVWDDYRWGLKA